MAKFALGVATGYIFADIIDVLLDKVKSYGHEASKPEKSESEDTNLT